MRKSNCYILIFIILMSVPAAAQEADISDALKQIESGREAAAQSILKELKLKSPADPSVIYLDALLTKNGDDALKKYSLLLEKFPGGKYTDAVIYHIFSYYYSLGYYKKAETYLARLKKEFPDSEFIKDAERKIPDLEEAPPDTMSKPIASPVEKKPVKAGNFTIQAGAFMNTDNATKLLDRLKNAGYSAEITTKEIGGTFLNVVNVGQFNAEEDAKPVVKELETKYGLKGRVVSAKK